MPDRAAVGGGQHGGVLLRPGRRAVLHERDQELVDAVVGQVGRDRGQLRPGAQLGVDAVDDGLLGHPPDPEPDRLVRLVPGEGVRLGSAGGELGGQRRVGPVEQARAASSLVETGRRPLRRVGAQAHALDLVQVDRADVADQVGDRPLRTARHHRGQVRPGRPPRGAGGSRRRGTPAVACSPYPHSLPRRDRHPVSWPAPPPGPAPRSGSPRRTTAAGCSRIRIRAPDRCSCQPRATSAAIRQTSAAAPDRDPRRRGAARSSRRPARRSGSYR